MIRSLLACHHLKMFKASSEIALNEIPIELDDLARIIWNTKLLCNVGDLMPSFFFWLDFNHYFITAFTCPVDIFEQGSSDKLRCHELLFRVSIHGTIIVKHMS